MQLGSCVIYKLFLHQLMLNTMKLQQFLRKQTFVYQKLHPSSSKSERNIKNFIKKQPTSSFIHRWEKTFLSKFSQAQGRKTISIDGRQYVDFAFGSEAIHGSQRQSSINSIVDGSHEIGQMTAMLPAQETQNVADELSKRFDFQYWSFCQSGLDANLMAIKLSKFITQRNKIIVVSGSHQYSESLQNVLSLQNSQSIQQEFKLKDDSIISFRIQSSYDLEGLQQMLQKEDIAAILLEPSNISIPIISQPGFLEYLGSICEKYETLIICDESGTFSINYDGMMKELNFKPDFITLERKIDGMEAGAIGTNQFIEQKFTNGIKENLFSANHSTDFSIDNPQAVYVINKSLNILSEQKFATMINFSTKIRESSEQLLKKYEIPWSLTQFGTKICYSFAGSEQANEVKSLRLVSEMLNEYLSLFLLNRGIVINPIDCTVRVSPVMTEEDVNKYCQVFEEALMQLRKIYAIKARL